MVSEDLNAISADWLKSLELASSTGDAISFASHFLSDGWFRDLLCFSWNFRTLSGREKIREFISEVVDGKSRLAYSGLHDFKIDDHTVNTPSSFKFPGPQGIEGIQGAFTFSITKPAALGRGFFRLTQDVDGKWKAFTLFTNMQDLVGYEESSTDQHGLYEGRKMTWDEGVDANFRAIEADPTVVIVGGGQTGLMNAARLRRLGIRALVIEKNASVGDSWRKRYPNLKLHTPAYQSSMLYSPYPTNFPKYIPKGKLANFLDSYAVNQELCIWLSSTVASAPVYDSSSARWTVEVQRGDQKVVLHPKHLVLATGNGSPRIPTWDGMNEFQGALYHSDFQPDAEQFRGKRAVVVGAGNASGDICQDFVAHDAAEVTMVQRSATYVVSAGAAEQTHFKLPFPDGSPVEELDFRNNSMPLAFLLQLTKTRGLQDVKMFDKELHEGLRKAGFNLTWELSPGSGEVGLEAFLLCRQAAGTMIDIGCGKLIIEGKVKVKQGQDISHFDKDGIVFKDGSKLSADVIVLATGNQPVMNNARALLGNEIADQLPSKVWGLDSEGELNQAFRPSGHPGLWFASGPFPFGRFLSKHLGLQILARELGIA
ncbi:FAD/NAD(P)-binding domain-containing protein [Suillus clintonianus]|uniref:FAD/NAD(P)-binding domain-containing protein n=1 Tax=Suillus clintonianus TaxID=1904413 RepID=UPI001B868670|nr:FAD/NAD(P)-binding domain-containing protein [Suillus clintonianus]KAG2133283.1 FAD/NAD(P)-binding domain-containing protein [Suillus clintonianus]